MPAIQEQDRVHIRINQRPEETIFEYDGPKEDLPEAALVARSLPSVSRPEVDAIVKIFCSGFILLGLIIYWTTPPPQPQTSSPQSARKY